MLYYTFSLIKDIDSNVDKRYKLYSAFKNYITKNDKENFEKLMVSNGYLRNRNEFFQS